MTAEGQVKQSAIMRWLKAPDRGPLLQWGSWYFFLLGVLGMFIGLFYMRHYSVPMQPIALYYLVAAYSSHFISLAYIPFLVVVLPLALLVPRRKIVMPVGVIVAALMLALALLDGLVYSENRWHITGLTMRILGGKTWSFGILYFLIFLVFGSLAARWVYKTFTKRTRQRYVGLAIGVVMVLLLVSAHLIHMWADAFYYVPVTKLTPRLPVFYPSTAKGFMREHGMVNASEGRKRELMRSVNVSPEGNFQYPLAKLEFDAPEKPLNLLLIVADSARPDVLTPEVAPNLSAFSSKTIRFINHYSGGNSTRPGMFSMFYGLPSVYWQYASSMQRPPVIMDAIIDHGYNIGVFGAAPFARLAELDRTAFRRLTDLEDISMEKYPASYQRDIVITENILKWIDDAATNTPFFGFMMYADPSPVTAPPDYPTQFTAPKGATAMQKRFALYKTSYHFVDSLVGRVLARVEELGLLENTVVIFAADHGEEFDENDNGYHGHGSAYSEYQIRTPMLIHWPGREPTVMSKRTSHNDLVATLMTELLGCKNDPADYCSGHGMFTDEEWQWLIVGSYHDVAIVEPDQIMISLSGGLMQVRDKHYRLIDDKKVDPSVIRAALHETSRFLR